MSGASISGDSMSVEPTGSSATCACCRKQFSLSSSFYEVVNAHRDPSLVTAFGSISAKVNAKVDTLAAAGVPADERVVTLDDAIDTIKTNHGIDVRTCRSSEFSVRIQGIVDTLLGITVLSVNGAQVCIIISSSFFIFKPMYFLCVV